MTTIAFDGRMLAGDGRVTDDGLICAKNDKKVFRVRGKLIGLAGDAAQCNQFLAWLKEGEKGRRPRVNKIVVMMVGADGKLLVFDRGDAAIECTPPHAIGSGAMAAIGAMHAGACATRAVKIAAKVDTSTGGRVRTLRLR